MAPQRHMTSSLNEGLSPQPTKTSNTPSASLRSLTSHQKGGGSEVASVLIPKMMKNRAQDYGVDDDGDVNYEIPNSRSTMVMLKRNLVLEESSPTPVVGGAPLSIPTRTFSQRQQPVKPHQLCRSLSDDESSWGRSLRAMVFGSRSFKNLSRPYPSNGDDDNDLEKALHGSSMKTKDTAIGGAAALGTDRQGMMSSHNNVLVRGGQGATPMMMIKNGDIGMNGNSSSSRSGSIGGRGSKSLLVKCGASMKTKSNNNIGMAGGDAPPAAAVTSSDFIGENISTSGKNGGGRGDSKKVAWSSSSSTKGSASSSSTSARVVYELKIDHGREDDGDEDDEDETVNSRNSCQGDDEPWPKKEKKKSGLFATAVIILKSFIGGGFLFLPHAMMKGGLLLSLLVLILIFCLALYCMTLLIRCCQPGVAEHYEDVAEVTFGSWGARLVEFCVVLSQLSFCTINAVVVAGNLRDVIWTAGDCDMTYKMSTEVLLWCAIAVYVPLCLIRHMKYLAPISLVANIGTASGVVMLFIAIGMELRQRQGIAPVPLVSWEGLPVALGTSIYMWEGAGLVLPIRDNAKKKVQKRFPQVLGTCLGTLLVTYVIYVIFCTFTFGTGLEVMILSNLPANGLGLIVQTVFALAIMATYPLMMFPASAIIERRLLSRSRFSNATASMCASWTLRTTLVILTLAVGTASMQQLDNFVALIGGLCGVPLAFTFPIILYMKLRPDEGLLWRVFHIAIVVAGFGVQIFSLYWAAASWHGVDEFAARCLERVQ